MYALSGKISEGTMRETFRKTFDQIADLPNSYLAVDDIEIGNGNRIPLVWLFILMAFVKISLSVGKNRNNERIEKHLYKNFNYLCIVIPDR